MRNIRHWFLPVFTLLCLAAFAVASAVLYSHNLELQQKNKSQQISEGISNQLRSEILSRISILKILAQQNVVRVNDNSYRDVATAIMSEFTDFYAINYVDAEGTIRKVHPIEPNKAAIGKNLLSRDDVKQYLLESRLDKKPRMSHRLMTYQKVYAFTLYIPLYDEKQNFTGWLNALIDIDKWVQDYLKSRSAQNTLVRVNWLGSQTPGISFGPTEVSEIYDYSYSIMNQTLVVEVGFAPNPVDVASSNLFKVILIFGSCMLLLVGYLIIRINFVNIQIKQNYANLSMKNTLLSSLSHDISTPLMVLGLSLKNFIKGEPSDKTQIERTSYALSTIEKMLRSARMMHSEGLGLSQIKAENVNLKMAVTESIKLLIEVCEEKKITFDIAGVDENVFVKADSNTLINNVLLNVFSNSVKVCKVGSKVKIFSNADSRWVKLVIENENKPSEALIKMYEKLSKPQPEAEGLGEQGTGLGLLQIRTFMHVYGGHVEYAITKDEKTQLIFNFKPVQA
jgi:signal transduction histidine kinase